MILDPLKRRVFRALHLDSIRRSPYRPAAFVNAAFKGLTEYRNRSLAHQDQKLLAFQTATAETMSSQFIYISISIDLIV
jgi:hypothetical protein